MSSNLIRGTIFIGDNREFFYGRMVKRLSFFSDTEKFQIQVLVRPPYLTNGEWRQLAVHMSWAHGFGCKSDDAGSIPASPTIFQ